MQIKEPEFKKEYLYLVISLLYSTGAFKRWFSTEKYILFLITILLVFLASIEGKTQMRKCLIYVVELK